MSAASSSPLASPSSSPDLQLDGICYCDVGRGIQLAYESFGSPSDPLLLMIMGINAQMIAWPDGFCRLLAAQGLRVIRFDNRDVGLSTHLNDAPVDFPTAFATKDFSTAPYKLADMADDVEALVRHLCCTRHGDSSSPSSPSSTPCAAHIVGASMGGMIAQEFALRHPKACLSLTSIMSTPDLRIGSPTPAAREVLYMPLATDRAALQEQAVQMYKIIGSEPYYKLDEQWHRDIAGLSFDRCFDPAGATRQLIAIWASQSRTERLATIRCPTLVIHGDTDSLIQVEGGRATAAAIPGSELCIVPGMGHNFPAALWDTIVNKIGAHTKRTQITSPSNVAASKL